MNICYTTSNLTISEPSPKTQMDYESGEESCMQDSNNDAPNKNILKKTSNCHGKLPKSEFHIFSNFCAVGISISFDFFTH